MLIVCCCLHGTEPAPKASSIIRNRTVARRSLHGADQQTSQMLAPGRFLELTRDRRDTAAAVANATTALTNGLSATNQKFAFMLFYLKHSKIDISQNVKSLPRGAEVFLTWRRFFAVPVVRPRIAIYYNPATALIWRYCSSRIWPGKTRIRTCRRRD